MPKTALALTELAQNFAHPPREFSPVPIWWWSGDKLERSRLRWQMEQLIAGGIYNVVILNLAPTSPLYGADPDQPVFMSEEWWALFRGVCEDARELGMRIWFYDQIGFSGANLQGEIVKAEPQFAGRSLASLTAEGEGALELICPSGGEPIGAVALPLDADGQATGPGIPVMLDGRAARINLPGYKRLRLVYAITRGFDYFSVEGCARLLDRVHGEFERRLGEFFGSPIVGSFQDELPTLPTWGIGFAEGFQRLKGYDLRDHLSSLFEGEDAESERVRADYHQVRAALSEATFFVPFFQWHEQRGLICGFDQQSYARSGEPNDSVRLYANYMQTHRWYGAPGSDHHGHAKIHSSLAHLYDRPRVWIEAFHSSGWGGTLEETFDWLLPWLRAGATLYDPHAVYYSTWGGWWEWAPPSTCWRQPYWRHYPIYANTVSRLCYLLSQGEHVADVGVVFPTTTVQSGYTITGPLPTAQAANDAFEALVGNMMFLNMVTGTLDGDRRDFDILDDASIQRGTVEGGALRIGDERFRALILPATRVLEAATARKLVEFVNGGGLLIGIGALPAHLLGGAVGDFDALKALVASGRVKQVETAQDVPGVLASMPRAVEAPVPTLHRRIGGVDVLFVPAAFPHATQPQHERGREWLHPQYTFDPANYQRHMKIRVRGFSGTPQLWDAVSGERRAVTVHPSGDAVEIDLPFDTSPAALLVWTDGETVAELPAPEPTSVVLDLPDVWTATLEQTLDNRNGDFTRPAAPGAPPVQTWHFGHRIESGDDGLSARWFDSDEDWSPVVATFGAYGWWRRAPADQLPAPVMTAAHGLDGEGWQPAQYSLSRGIYKDELHVPNLGPKGHVPEEFLDFGTFLADESVQFRTSVWMPQAQALTLALGAGAAKQVWVNGEPVGRDTPGYLWLSPVTLKAGLNLLEWRLTPERGGALRAYWALVTDAETFVRPERMIPVDEARRDSRLSFSLDVDIPFAPTAFKVQVSADSPCRLLVNGVEVGRQGGFDPYASLSRVQPYIVKNGLKGRNTITVEAQDLGKAEDAYAGNMLQGVNGNTAVQVDAVIKGAGGESLSVVSGPHWTVRRDDGAPRPVRLYRTPWLDPAWSHLWRRPHPLPGAMWIEDRPADETVVPVSPDAFAGSERVEWFRWTLPPGAAAMRLPVSGAARLWVDEQEVAVQNGTASIPASTQAARTATLRVTSARGKSGGAVFDGPVTYTLGSAGGAIRLGEWANEGLHAHSGGVRYRTTFTLDMKSEQRLVLDLGKVRGTAEVWLNGQSLGVRLWSPYRFDLTGAAKSGENVLEVLVLNTLAPYLHAVSPTHYVHPGQTVSGLFGPVQVLSD